jgi:predicted extracellular nuclease
MNNHMTVITSTDAERIADDILSTTDGILGVSIMDMRGNPLASKSKESFKEAFGVTQDRGKHGGTLAVAVLNVVNEVRNIFGGPKAIITVHENCKLMLVPVPSFQILVGLVLQRSVNAEDDNDNIANKIERLLADMLWQ